MVAAVAVVLTGCLSTSPPSESLSPGERVDATLSAEIFRPSPGLNSFEGREATIGVDPDGVLFAYLRAPQTLDLIVISSQDGGEQWQRVDATRPGTFQDTDPWLHVDRETGRVFVGQLYALCMWLNWSDDGGATWETNPSGGCGSPLFHFQKITTGPPVPGLATRGFANVVYVSSLALREPDRTQPLNGINGGTPSYVTRSLDGGVTFEESVLVHPMKEGCISFPSGVAVSPDGAAYSALGWCEGLRISRSDDSGRSWSLVASITEDGWHEYGNSPWLAVRPDGSLILVYVAKDARTYVRESRDRGVTWTEATRLGNESIQTTMFSTIDSDKHGNVFAAFIGTTEKVTDWTRPAHEYGPDSRMWNLFVASLPVGASKWTVARATDDADPVQRGCVYVADPDDAVGQFGKCKNLGDFIGVASHDGTAWVAYVDGCDRCQDAESSQDLGFHVARWGLPSTPEAGP